MADNRFVLAAVNGDLRSVQQKVSRGQPIDVLHSTLKYSALHAAADHGYFDIVEFLVEKGANFEKDTPLHFAISSGHYKVVDYLVRNGADKHAKDKDGRRALDRAIEFRRLDGVIMLADLPSAPDPPTCISVTASTLSISWVEPSGHGVGILAYQVHVVSDDCCIPDLKPEGVLGDAVHMEPHKNPFVIETEAGNPEDDDTDSDSDEDVGRPTRKPAVRPSLQAEGGDEEAEEYLRWTAYHTLQAERRQRWLQPQRIDLPRAFVIDTDERTSLLLSGIPPANDMRIRVRAYSVTGWGGWSEYTSMSTGSDVPYPPAAVTCTDVTRNTASIRWHPSRDNGAEIDAYRVEICAYTPAECEAAAKGDLASFMGSRLSGVVESLLATGLATREESRLAHTSRSRLDKYQGITVAAKGSEEPSMPEAGGTPGEGMADGMLSVVTTAVARQSQGAAVDAGTDDSDIDSDGHSPAERRAQTPPLPSSVRGRRPGAGSGVDGIDNVPSSTVAAFEEATRAAVQDTNQAEGYRRQYRLSSGLTEASLGHAAQVSGTLRAAAPFAASDNPQASDRQGLVALHETEPPAGHSPGPSEESYTDPLPHRGVPPMDLAGFVEASPSAAISANPDPHTQTARTGRTVVGSDGVPVRAQPTVLRVAGVGVEPVEEIRTKTTDELSVGDADADGRTATQGSQGWTPRERLGAALQRRASTGQNMASRLQSARSMGSLGLFAGDVGVFDDELADDDAHEGRAGYGSLSDTSSERTLTEEGDTAVPTAGGLGSIHGSVHSSTRPHASDSRTGSALDLYLGVEGQDFDGPAYSVASSMDASQLAAQDRRHQWLQAGLGHSDRDLETAEGDDTGSIPHSTNEHATTGTTTPMPGARNITSADGDTPRLAETPDTEAAARHAAATSTAPPSRAKPSVPRKPPQYLSPALEDILHRRWVVATMAADPKKASFDIENLSAHWGFRVRVAAHNKHGWGRYSEPSPFFRMPAQPILIHTSRTTMTVAWEPPAGVTNEEAWFLDPDGCERVLLDSTATIDTPPSVRAPARSSGMASAIPPPVDMACVNVIRGVDATYWTKMRIPRGIAPIVKYQAQYQVHIKDIVDGCQRWRLMHRFSTEWHALVTHLPLHRFRYAYAPQNHAAAQEFWQAELDSGVWGCMARLYGDRDVDRMQAIMNASPVAAIVAQAAEKAARGRKSTVEDDSDPEDDSHRWPEAADRNDMQQTLWSRATCTRGIPLAPVEALVQNGTGVLTALGAFRHPSRTLHELQTSVSMYTSANLTGRLLESPYRLANPSIMCGVDFDPVRMPPDDPFDQTDDAGGPWIDCDVLQRGKARVASLTGLLPGTRYRFRVRADVGAGFGPWDKAPLSAWFRTDDQAPARPSEVHATAISESDIVVMWQAPRSNGARIISYAVQRRRERTADDSDDSESDFDEHAATLPVDGLTARAGRLKRARNDHTRLPSVPLTQRSARIEDVIEGVAGRGEEAKTSDGSDSDEADDPNDPMFRRMVRDLPPSDKQWVAEGGPISAYAAIVAAMAEAKRLAANGNRDMQARVERQRADAEMRFVDKKDSQYVDVLAQHFYNRHRSPRSIRHAEADRFETGMPAGPTSDEQQLLAAVGLSSTDGEDYPLLYPIEVRPSTSDAHLQHLSGRLHSERLEDQSDSSPAMHARGAIGSRGLRGSRWETVGSMDSYLVYPGACGSLLAWHFTGLRAGSRHQFRIKAINSVGWGRHSVASNLARTHSTAPDAPSCPTVSTLSSSSILLAISLPRSNGRKISELLVERTKTVSGDHPDESDVDEHGGDYIPPASRPYMLEEDLEDGTRLALLTGDKFLNQLTWKVLPLPPPVAETADRRRIVYDAYEAVMHEKGLSLALATNTSSGSDDDGLTDPPEDTPQALAVVASGNKRTVHTDPLPATKSLPNSVLFDLSPGRPYVVLQVSGFYPGSQHLFRAKCRNSIGWSAFSRPSREVACHCDVPLRPTELDVTATSPYAIMVRWQVPHDNGEQILYYHLQRRRIRAGTDPNDSDSDVPPELVGTSADDDNWVTVTQRIDPLQARGVGQGLGAGMVSSSMQSDILDYNPETPRSVGINDMRLYDSDSSDSSHAEQHSGSLSARSGHKGRGGGGALDAEALLNDGARMLQLQLERRKREEYKASKFPVGTTLGWLVMGLRPGSRHHFRVRAKNSMGVGCFLVSEHRTRTSVAVPDAPVDVVAKPVDSYTFFVRWQVPRSNGARIEAYRLQRRRVRGGGTVDDSDSDVELGMQRGGLDDSDWVDVETQPEPKDYAESLGEGSDLMDTVATTQSFHSVFESAVDIPAPLTRKKWDQHRYLWKRPGTARRTRALPAGEADVSDTVRVLLTPRRRCDHEWVSQPVRGGCHVGYVVPHLRAGSRHEFRVVAVNQSGRSEQSRESAVHKLTPAPPSPIGPPIILNRSPFSLIVALEIPRSNGARIRKFELQRRRLHGELDTADAHADGAEAVDAANHREDSRPTAQQLLLRQEVDENDPAYDADKADEGEVEVSLRVAEHGHAELPEGSITVDDPTKLQAWNMGRWRVVDELDPARFEVIRPPLDVHDTTPLISLDDIMERMKADGLTSGVEVSEYPLLDDLDIHREHVVRFPSKHPTPQLTPRVAEHQARLLQDRLGPAELRDKTPDVSLNHPTLLNSTSTTGTGISGMLQDASPRYSVVARTSQRKAILKQGDRTGSGSTAEEASTAMVRGGQSSSRPAPLPPSPRDRSVSLWDRDVAPPGFDTRTQQARSDALRTAVASDKSDTMRMLGTLRLSGGVHGEPLSHVLEDHDDSSTGWHVPGTKYIIYECRKLLPLTTHEFRVRAWSAAGAAEFNAHSLAGQTSPYVPFKCNQPTISAATASLVSIKWIPPRQNGVPIDRYEVQMVKLPSRTFNASAGGVDSLASYLAGGSTWSEATDSNKLDMVGLGWGSGLDVAPVRRPAAGRRSQPQPATADRSTTALWLRRSGEPATAELSEQSIAMGEIDVNDWNWFTLSDTVLDSGYLANEVVPAAAYRFRIRAHNALGWGDFSPPSDIAKTKRRI